MRLVLSVIIAAMTLSTSTFAKSSQQYDGSLITYQQFMRLSTDKRMTYLQDLRDLLVMLEKSSTRYDVASYNGEGGLNQLKEQIASFIKMAEFLPSASAEPALPIGERPRLRANVPVWNSTARTGMCLVPEHVFDPELGTCVRTHGGTTGVEALVNWTETCPSGYITASNRGLPTHRCIPDESYAALSNDRRKEIAFGQRLNPNIWDGENAEFFRRYAHGANLYDNDGQRASPAPGNGTAVTQGTRPGDRPVGGAVQPPQSVAITPAPGDVSSSAPTPARPEPPPASAANSCRFQELSCQDLSASERTSLIARFRSDRNANVCIASGYFTRKNQRPQAGKGSCEIIKEMRQNAAGGVKKCEKDAAGKEQGICNPTVFCVGLKINQKVRDQMKRDAHANNVRLAIARREQELRRKLNAAETQQITAAVPQITDEKLNNALKTIEGSDQKLQNLSYCAPVSQDMTQACAAKLQDHIEKRTGVSGYVGEGYDYVKCDPSKLKGFALQNEWDKLREDTVNQYKSQCQQNANANFRALFCKECNEIGRHIFAMNQRAVGTGCADSVPGPATRPSGETGAIPERGTVSDETP